MQDFTGMRIIAYISPNCAWSGGVRLVLEKHGLAYEPRDVSRDSMAFAEMVRRTGQTHTPCVDIDGVMLADVSGQEVEDFLLSHELIKPAQGLGSEETSTKKPTTTTFVAGSKLVETTRFF
jgi:monothiol glutaredoxin